MTQELLEKYLRGALLTEDEQESLTKILDTDEGRRQFTACLEEWVLLAEVAKKLADADVVYKGLPSIPLRLRSADSPRTGTRLAAARPSPWVGWWLTGLVASIVFIILVGYILGESSVRRPVERPQPIGRGPSPKTLEPVSARENYTPSSPLAPSSGKPLGIQDPMVPRTVAPAVPEKPAPEVTVSTPSTPDPTREPAVTRSPLRDAHPTSGEKATTVATSVTVEKIQGEVLVLGPGSRAAAKTGQALPSSAGLETVGSQSSAVVRFQDGTLVDLAGDTKVDSFTRRGSTDPAAGNSGLILARGVLDANVSKQAPNRAMVFCTPHAEARIIGTRLSLAVAPDSTLLEVSEGKVRLTRMEDGNSVDVSAGFGAVVGPGIPLMALASRARDGRSSPPRTEPAIRKGVEYLLRRSDFGILKQRKDELVLLACLHAGLPEDHPRVQEFLRRMLEAPLEKTYLVALQAVILEEVDRVKYQMRIAQCAQFLVDNMGRNGQWDYGTPSIFVETLQGNPAPAKAPGPSAVKPKEADTGAAAPSHQLPKIVRKIAILKKRDGPAKGDNSNSQFAALGLRAANDAGVLLPKDVLLQARKWWYDSQQPEAQDRDPGAAGWSYGAKDNFHSYGSMTAGAVGTLAIYDYLLEGSWKTDKIAQKGLDWIARHFTVSENPGPAESHAFGGENKYYYLYAISRMGTYCGQDAFGRHDWYAEGTTAILAAQASDGSWKENDAVCDTCFAILFLRRAARPLAVETEVRPGGRK